MQSTEFLVVGCGPAGGTAAREAARAGVPTIVLERDAVVGERRVCAAGLRPGFCEDFDLPRSIVHLDLPAITLSTARATYRFETGTAHTTTREELDGTIGALAVAEGAEIRTSAAVRGLRRDGERLVVDYVDPRTHERAQLHARTVFLATGAATQIERIEPAFAYAPWRAGLLTCIQYRLYPERPALASAYETLELHYYVGRHCKEAIIAWVFPKRDHLAIGLGVGPKADAGTLRAELDAFVARTQQRLFPGVPYTLRREGNLLYGGAPRPQIARSGVLLGGTAAGLVDATTGEGIYEAAATGRFAAEAAAAVHRGRARDAGPLYEGATKQAFYGRLRHRHKLMTFLERKPARFDVLFRQLETTPRFAALLQRERAEFTPLQWLYLYLQAARFALAAQRV